MTRSSRTRRAPAPPARRRARRGQGEELRGEIITAARDLLAAAGDSEAVSIRAVAEAVGVTSPSIYLHFADKDELMVAVVAEVFTDLNAAMVAAADGVEDPLQRLCAYGMAYVEFAVQHPEQYRVAAMQRAMPGEAGPFDGSPVDHVLHDSAFARLNETVAECIAAGAFPPGDPVQASMQMWAAAHGIAALMISKPFLPWGDKREFANRALASAALGLAGVEAFTGPPVASQVAQWRAAQRPATG